MSRVHVPHPGPDRDLGAGADARVLLEIRRTGDLQVHTKQIGLERGAARDRRLHARSVADLGSEHGPSNRSLRQGTNDAETAVFLARDFPEPAELAG